MAESKEFRRRWAILVDTTRTQLWPVPAAGIVIAVALGIGLTRLDARIDAQLPSAVSEYLFTGGADAARSILSTIAGSLITATSLTFSLTVVTLQLASSQFSPRLLRTFSRDRFVHLTLAVFLSTFAYALTVLRYIRSSGDNRDLFVPQISVTLAYLFTLASVLFLVLFLAHLARQIRVETMLRNVHTEAQDTAETMLFERDSSAPMPTPPSAPLTARPVLARQSGFLTSVDEEELLEAALHADAVIQLDPMPGSLLVEGSPIAFIWARSTSTALTDDQIEDLAGCVYGAVHVGFERTSAQDIGFGLRQLADVANKALSPGINDPTTAVHALGHSSALLCGLTKYRLGHHTIADDGGVVRVILLRPDLPELLELVVAQPRRYGAADPDVLASLFELLRSVAWSCRLPLHREAVTVQLRRLRATAHDQGFDDDERAHLHKLDSDVQAALGGSWPPAVTAA